jgi:hypothetical protein
VRIAGKVFEDLERATERGLGVDDPVFGAQAAEERLPGFWVGEGGEFARESQSALCLSFAEEFEEFRAEEAAEDPHREEESLSTGDPARSVEGDPAPRDDAVKVGVQMEVLAPGMQDGEESEMCPEMLRVAADREERLSCGSEEVAVDLAGVLEREGSEGVGEGEDHVEVADVKEIGGLGVEPFLARGSLAFRAVAVKAGVVGDLLVRARTVID